MGWKQLSISFKTAFINSTVVLTLLAIVATFIINKQDSLVDFILTRYQGMIQQTFQNQAERDNRSLKERHAINAKICSGMSGFFVYNFRSDGLKTNLMSLLALPDISAIEILDSEGGPFVALWKNNGEVMEGEAMDDGVVLNNDKMFTEEIFYDKELAGTVKLYYTDALLHKQLEDSEQDLQREVDTLGTEVTDTILDAKYSQIIAFVFVVISLVVTIILTLRFIVITRLKMITSGLRDIAEGEGDLTKRLASKFDDRSLVFFDKFSNRRGCIL